MENKDIILTAYKIDYAFVTGHDPVPQETVMYLYAATGVDARAIFNQYCRDMNIKIFKIKTIIKEYPASSDIKIFTAHKLLNTNEEKSFEYIEDSYKMSDIISQIYGILELYVVEKYNTATTRKSLEQIAVKFINEYNPLSIPHIQWFKAKCNEENNPPNVIDLKIIVLTIIWQDGQTEYASDMIFGPPQSIINYLNSK